MTHEDAGHYAKKHPAGTAIDPKVKGSLENASKEGKITCAAAHRVAGEAGVPPSDVGRNIDLMELRISRCQMGLFGYEPEKKIVVAAETVAPPVATAIETATVDGRLPCARSWELAKRLNLSKMAFSAACEAMGIKIKPCQLGAF